jgi:hypothetical protein
MVQFESDSHVLTEAIRTRHKDIIQIMLSYVNFEVKFVRRQTNIVAHTLAQTINSWTNFHIFEIVHLCIEHLSINEMH